MPSMHFTAHLSIQQGFRLVCSADTQQAHQVLVNLVASLRPQRWARALPRN